MLKRQIEFTVRISQREERGKEETYQKKGKERKKGRNESGAKEWQKDKERERERKRAETHQNKLWPHGMRAALISPSKHTIQSRLREVFADLVPPFRLPNDPSDSVGELEVVVDPDTAEENAPRTVPLAANPLVES